MKPIGEILIEQGAISQEQLQMALKEQKNSTKKRRLGEVLIQLGMVEERDIVVALSIQFNFPYLSLRNISLKGDLLKLVPANLVRQCHFIPIDKTGSILTVIMSDPSDENAISEIEKSTKCKVHAFIGTHSEIEHAIEQYYAEEVGSKKPNAP